MRCPFSSVSHIIIAFIFSSCVAIQAESPFVLCVSSSRLFSFYPLFLLPSSSLALIPNSSFICSLSSLNLVTSCSACSSNSGASSVPDPSPCLSNLSKRSCSMVTLMASSTLTSSWGYLRALFRIPLLVSRCLAHFRLGRRCASRVCCLVRFWVLLLRDLHFRLKGSCLVPHAR